MSWGAARGAPPGEPCWPSGAWELLWDMISLDRLTAPFASRSCSSAGGSSGKCCSVLISPWLASSPCLFVWLFVFLALTHLTPKIQQTCHELPVSGIIHVVADIIIP